MTDTTPPNPTPGPPSPATVYRASHDSIVMGLYTTRAEARAHCEDLIRREGVPAGHALDWVPDDDPDDCPEELVTSYPGDELATITGYVVTPLAVAAKYDPEADE